jgi:hypothetical protein
MIKKKSFLAGLLAISAAFIITSCGSAGDTNTGQGGPEVSPEEYTDLGPAAVDTTNSALVGTTTPEEGVIVEDIVNVKIEGDLETDTGDTGLAAAESILDGAISSEAIAAVADGISPAEDTSQNADVITDSEESAADEEADTAVTEPSDTTAASDVIVVSGDAVDALDNDEAVGQSDSDYSLDSSQGRWFEETKKELFSDADSKAIKAEIKTLREQIKTILASFKNKETDKKDARAQIKQIREKIAVLRDKIGNGGRIQSGIYTNWAKENLILNIKKGEPGWYRIIIIAKNRGKLPENYDRFTFSVNNNNNETLAGISVKASDTVYHRGSADIRLDNPAGTSLNLVWTNDAYMKDQYDTNVNIKKVVLKKIKEPKEKPVNVKHLNGDEFSFTDGRWFFEKTYAHTFWANQIIGYTFNNLEEGEYEVTITAKNYDSLPLEKNYKEFNIEIDSDYDSASMNIKASDKSWNHETVKMNFAKGSTTLYINWTNDVYKENDYDSNIMIKTISVKKVQKSSLTAFLLRTKPGNKVFVLGAFLMLSGLIFGIYLKNRNTSEA